MTKKPQTSKDAAEKVAKNIRRKTRQNYSAEEKIRIVLAGLSGEESISVLCPCGATLGQPFLHQPRRFVRSCLVLRFMG